MDTAEMRLLTVPQFATRVARSEDEVLALIATRDVKALRPDPKGGYRVLETEVDRILQERTTRIKPVKTREGVTENTVALSVHLSAVTALESEKKRNGRLERLNSNLQSELFGYLRVLEESSKELFEAKIRMRATNERLLELEKERLAIKQPRPWWKRLFGL